jgi:N-acyl-D-aspartate/D-glutamate deacylase
MGDDASVRQRPTADEMAEMKRLVTEAMQQGAIGLGASYSLNHSGHGGVPMPSTISDLGEFDALVGAMGEAGRGVVEISSGPRTVAEMEEIAARHGRRIFRGTALALYNEQYPQRSSGRVHAARRSAAAPAPPRAIRQPRGAKEPCLDRRSAMINRVAVDRNRHWCVFLDWLLPGPTGSV